MGMGTPEWVLYLRKSKGRAGIGRQRAITTAHIEQRGGKVVAEFADTDRTAFARTGEARPDRAGFDAMIALLRTRPGLGAAAWHADRLTRNDEDTATLMTVCTEGGHLIETPRGGTYDLSTATGRKRLRDDASDAIYEVDHMRERIKAAKDESKAAGRWLGGRRPFGWDQARGGDGLVLVLNAAEAELIRTGTEAVLAGASLRSITAEWNATGITGTGGGVWANREVSTTLRRARNAGLAEHDHGHGLQVTGKGQWPPIVTEDQWRTAKAILENPARRTQRGTQPAHLLSGLARCGVCGTPVVAGRGRNRRTVYKDKPKTGKGHVARDATALDEYAAELVVAWIERFGKDALNPPAPDTSLLASQLKAAEATLEALQGAADAGEITDEQWLRRVTPLNRKVRTLRDRMTATAAAGVPAHVFTEDDIRAGWDAANLDAKRSMVRALMTLHILPVPAGAHGCPPGWKRGDGPYFRAEFIRVEWHGKDPGVSSGSA